MITTWSHKGLKAFFENGSLKGIDPKHAKKIRLQLDALNAATTVQAMNWPGWRLHQWRGRKTVWSVDVNGPWRITFDFVDGNAQNVDYIQDH